MAEIVPPPLSAPEVGGVGGVGPDPSIDGLPKRFGKYTLLRKLATGGMAELFLAIQRSVAGFEKLIVIKRILPSMNQDQAFIDMLLHEARIAATLSHANIVQIFDVGQVDGTYYIAMEHVHGEDLRSIVRQMRNKGVTEFPLEHALGIMIGVCGGLAYAHEKKDLDGSSLNIVHRDISPQNVVVTFAGDMKIVDFGIAKSDTKLSMAVETRSGRLKGKVPYMSPEQARGEALDARSDIFAVGVMLFELTTGKRLFKGASEFETLKLICEREYPIPSQVRAGYPVELEYIVMRALAKDRTARFQTAREMQGALEEYVRRERIPVSNIALTQFMQSLFEDKLAAQKEALMQGKQLADIIELQHGADPPPADADNSGRLSSSILSAPAASRTVTNLGARRSRPLAWLGLLGVLLAGGAGSAYWVARHKAAPSNAVVKDPNPPPPARRGSLSITTDPPGASIWLSGDLRPEVTPATLVELPTGRALDVKLTKDGFEQARQSVTLTDAAPLATLSLTLSHGSVAVEVSVLPPGAKPVILLDGKPYPGGRIDGISSGDEHKLVIAAPGYVDQSFAFIGAPQEKKSFDVVLQKEPHHSHAGGGTAAPPIAAGTGKMNVGASGGWCNVTIDGSPRGATPVAGIEVAAGPHRVTCSPPEKPPLTATVVVPADGTARYRFTLQ